MIYKNTMKIFFSNFEMVWKIALYYILNFIIVCGVVYLCVNPYLQLLNNSGITTDILNIYTDFLSNLNLTQLFSSLSDLIDHGWILITENITQFWLTFVALGIVLIFIRSIINGLIVMPACNSLHYYMGSMNKNGFYSSFRDCFWKSLKIQLSQFVTILPIKIVFCLMFVGLLQLFKYSFIVSVIAVVLILILTILFFAMQISIFAGWTPTVVVLNFSIFKSLKVSIKNSLRNFRKVFGGAIGIVITICLINVIIAPFTFLIGLMITMPASYLIYSVYGMVVVYEGQGMRYYVDIYNVITPKKREVRDKLKEMKFIV